MSQGEKPETHRNFPVVNPAIYLVIEQRICENCYFSHSQPIEPKV